MRLRVPEEEIGVYGRTTGVQLPLGQDMVRTAAVCSVSSRRLIFSTTQLFWYDRKKSSKKKKKKDGLTRQWQTAKSVRTRQPEPQPLCVMRDHLGALERQ